MFVGQFRNSEQEPLLLHSSPRICSAQEATRADQGIPGTCGCSEARRGNQDRTSKITSNAICSVEHGSRARLSRHLLFQQTFLMNLCANKIKLSLTLSQKRHQSASTSTSSYPIVSISILIPSESTETGGSGFATIPPPIEMRSPS